MRSNLFVWRYLDLADSNSFSQYSNIKITRELEMPQETRADDSNQPFERQIQIQQQHYNQYQMLLELIVDIKEMETKLIKASKYYLILSNLIFYPSLVLNTLIGASVLSTSTNPLIDDCSAETKTAYIECLDNMDDSAIESAQTITTWKSYVLAGIAFLNAILIGIQKTIRPAEKSETFQMNSRRWGCLLRQMVVYKELTRRKAYSVMQMRNFLSQYQMLVENCPNLPGWLIVDTK